MKSRIFYWLLGLYVLTTISVVFAHEMTGWIAPEEARKVKNPIKATKTSIQKGKEVYEKKCSLCHGAKGDGKGPASGGLSPKPTNFRESHGEKMTDGEHFWKITTGRGAMPSLRKDLTGEERWHVINYLDTFMKHNRITLRRRKWNSETLSPSYPQGLWQLSRNNFRNLASKD